ncbi:MAG: hypothetical protein JWR84_195 [Caulobacter sp.]|nr:hypothetical protein [Caulobacter sp.]
MRVSGLAVAMAISICAPAFAQDAAAPTTPVTPVAGPVVPKNTVIAISLTQEVSSATAKPGDKFTIKLDQPIKYGDQVVVPAGAAGIGEVVHAAPKGNGGRAGEILVAARYLEFNGQRIPLKGFQLSAGGLDTSSGSLWAMGLVKGGETALPVGAGGPAKLALDLPVTAAIEPAATAVPVSAPAPAAAPVDPNKE